MRTTPHGGWAGWAALATLALCAAAPTAAQQDDPRAALFVRNTCTQCHAISALGLRAATDVGPDLTFAYADVVNRYGTTLEYFLGHPSGIMRMILSAHVELAPEARDSIVQVLRELFEQRRADMDPEVPSAPPLRGGDSGSAAPEHSGGPDPGTREFQAEVER